MSEMQIGFSKEQTIREAKRLFMSAAEVDNDFTPMSYAMIEEQMKEQGYKVSKSSIGRWAVDGQWKAELDANISHLIISSDDASDELSKRASEATMHSTKVSLEDNSELLSVSTEILKTKLKEISKKTTPTDKDTKLVLGIAKFAAEREDRMLDRQAALQVADMMSADQALSRLEAVDIEIEEADVLDAELEQQIAELEAGDDFEDESEEFE